MPVQTSGETLQAQALFSLNTWKENVKLVLVKNDRYFESDQG